MAECAWDMSNLVRSNLATSKSKLRESFVSKKFTLEAIVQVARSPGTKSLDTNRILV